MGRRSKLFQYTKIKQINQRDAFEKDHAFTEDILTHNTTRQFYLQPESKRGGGINIVQLAHIQVNSLKLPQSDNKENLCYRRYREKPRTRGKDG